MEIKGYWTIPKIENLGFKLISNNKLWCHFRGHGFDVFINLDTKYVKGNNFNFHSYKNAYNGNFKAKLENEEEFNNLLKYIVYAK
jgi:hypothetical protein